MSVDPSIVDGSDGRVDGADARVATAFEREDSRPPEAATASGRARASAELRNRDREQTPVSEGNVALLEETIIPSPHSVELHRTPTSDYVFRFMSPTPHVAELFHGNTRITPHSLANAVMDGDALMAARKWFYTTAYQPREEVLDEPAAREAGLLWDLESLADQAGAGILRLRDEDVPELAYGLDLMVVADGRCYRLMPGDDRLWLERSYSNTQQDQIRASLPELSEEVWSREPVLLFLVTAAWRYMSLQGARGYRRTLMDGGRVIHALSEAAKLASTELAVSLDFFDTRLDCLLKLDGVERSTLAVLAFARQEADPAVAEDDEEL